MAEDYYPPAEAEPMPEKQEETERDEESMGDTALLPKSMFSESCKEGDTYSFKIVKVYDDEVEVRKVSAKPTSEPASPEAQLEAMATEE